MDKLDTLHRKTRYPDDLDRLYNLRQAADLLCLATSTIRKKIKAGIIQSVQLTAGGRVLISESEIRRLRSGTALIERKPRTIAAPVAAVVSPDVPEVLPVPAVVSPAVAEVLPVAAIDDDDSITAGVF